MDLRSGGNRDDIARGKNREDMARVENSEEMLTNSVTVEKAYEDKNEIVKNDSVESECKPNITSVGQKTPEDDVETTKRESSKPEPKIRYKVGTEEVKLIFFFIQQGI